ncbi:hypothetical protein BJX64DRAFT_261452 [Aspergillus heterothallicus]
MSCENLGRDTPLSFAESEDGGQAMAPRASTDNGTSKLHAYRRFMKEMAVAIALSGGEEYLASRLAKDRDRNGRFFTSRVPKQAIFGSLWFIPLNRWLLRATQRLFGTHTDPVSRLCSIIFGMLVVAPLQRIYLLTGGALCAGARTYHQVRATVNAGLWPAMKVLLLAYPVAVVVAWNFLPKHAWSPFFDVVNWALNTQSNKRVKQKRLAALRIRHMADRRYSLESDADEDEDLEKEGLTPYATSTAAPLANQSTAFDAEGASRAMTRPLYGDARFDRPLSPPPWLRPVNDSSDMDAEERGPQLPDIQPRMAYPMRPLYRAHRGSRRYNRSRRSSEDSNSSSTDSADSAYRRMYQRYQLRRPILGIVRTDSDATDDEAPVDAGPGRATAESPDVTDSEWVNTEDSSSAADSLDQETGSEIDSDTSSEMPTRPWWMAR